MNVTEKKPNNALVFLDFDFMHGSKIEHLKNGLRAKFEFDFAIFYHKNFF